MDASHLHARRMILACFLTMFVMLFVLYAVGQGSSITISDVIVPVRYIIQERIHKSSHEVDLFENVLESPEWTPYMDILKESEVFKDPPLTDSKKGLGIGLSMVFLRDSTKVYNVGDEVRIGFTSRDGYGNIRRRGGDQFRVRILEKNLNASASGYVVDHKNGSYTAVVRALWPGRPKISIVNGCPREIVRAWYYTLNKLPGTRRYLANYRVKNATSKVKTLEGLCHPILERITNISKHFCNRTKQNGEAALYCHRPDSVSCDDFTRYSIRDYQKRATFTNAELHLSERYGEVLESIQISVKGRPLETGQTKVPSCAKYNVSKLWRQQSPVGFFFNNFWKTIHCKGISDQDVKNCIRNRHFILAGDSTLRQWFEYIETRFDCRLKSKGMMYKACQSLAYNMSAEISFHSIPGHYIVREPAIHSIHQFIDGYKFSTDRILVFHMQGHLSTYHPRVFRERMVQVRKSIDKLMTKYPNLRIYFKGPHTFQDRYDRFSDYFGYVYRTIMLEIFEGLYDKIVYLDSKDMTIATDQMDNHPTSEVVQGMVNQFLSYVCEA